MKFWVNVELSGGSCRSNNDVDTRYVPCQWSVEHILNDFREKPTLLIWLVEQLEWRCHCTSLMVHAVRIGCKSGGRIELSPLCYSCLFEKSNLHSIYNTSFRILKNGNNISTTKNHMLQATSGINDFFVDHFWNWLLLNVTKFLL